MVLGHPAMQFAPCNDPKQARRAWCHSKTHKMHFMTQCNGSQGPEACTNGERRSIRRHRKMFRVLGHPAMQFAPCNDPKQARRAWCHSEPPIAPPAGTCVYNNCTLRLKITLQRCNWAWSWFECFGGPLVVPSIDSKRLMVIIPISSASCSLKICIDFLCCTQQR